MKKLNFNKGWEFRVGGGSSLEALMSGEVCPPQKVTLPHDASIAKKRNPQEPGGSGNGFFVRKIIITPKSFNYSLRTVKKKSG